MKDGEKINTYWIIYFLIITLGIIGLMILYYYAGSPNLSWWRMG